MGKPPRRQTSVLWNYYDKDPQCATKAICRFCNNSYSFSTTTANLRSHLKRVHTEEYVNINWNGKFENEGMFSTILTTNLFIIPVTIPVTFISTITPFRY